jgi:hypothetical protein
MSNTRIAALDASGDRAGSSAAFSEPAQRRRDDSLIAAPIRSRRNALISQPKPSSWRRGSLRKPSRQCLVSPCDQQGGEPGGQGEHGRWPSMGSHAESISSTDKLNGSQPTGLHGRSRDADGSHRRPRSPLAARCVRANSRLEAGPKSSLPRDSARGTRGTARGSAKALFDHVVGQRQAGQTRQGRAGSEEPGPMDSCEQASEQGPIDGREQRRRVG